jgi:hypothetical protein
MTTAFLLASLTAAANAYPDLSGCSQRADHTAHADTAGSVSHPASQENHHDADAGDPDASDACCGTCNRCNNYFDAHFQALSLAAAPTSALAPHAYVPTPPVHATNFTSRPHLPPPRATFVLRQS